MLLKLTCLVPLFPLIGSIINGFFGLRIGKNAVGIIAAGSMALSFLTSILVFIGFLLLPEGQHIFEQVVWSWFGAGDFSVDFGFQVDPLTLVMMFVVTGVGFIIHVYAIGYMHEEYSFYRFFAYFNLFASAMLLLIMGNNFLLMFIGWEGVGCCSYFLIGYYFEKKSACDAGTKAFIVNRVGDFAFLLAVMYIFNIFGTIDFSEVMHAAPEKLVYAGEAVTIITMLLFVGATGKSAQIPLYTWLPDAMEGPTPVSALIHAATMVTAGVYMIVRCNALFNLAPMTMLVVAGIGAATAIMAATIGMTQFDIKRVLAYSTVSQIGYMILACGVGAYTAAIFHLVTHAFFKALLFLGSGCVIHSFNEQQDIRSMGGVWKKIPYTYALMIIGTLALTGFPLLSGYYSKDAIIEFAYLKGNTIGYYGASVGIFTALLTAIYSWRLIFKTFHGKYNNKESNLNSIKESPLIMLMPSCLLAIGAIFAGLAFKEIFIGSNGSEFWGSSILFLNAIQHNHPPFWFISITPVIVILAIPISYYLFVENEKILKYFIEKNQFLYNFLLRKWYFDELYNFIFVEPIKKIGLFFWKKGDINIIDRYGPDGLSKLVKIISDKAVNFQSGYLYHYAFVMLIGFSILLTYLIIY